MVDVVFEDVLKKGSKYCAAPGCTNHRLESTISFFRFPKDEDRCEKWINFCGRKEFEDKSAEYMYAHFRLCSAHFDKSEFISNGFRNRLSKSAVPTISCICMPIKLRVEPDKCRPLKRVKAKHEDVVDSTNSSYLTPHVDQDGTFDVDEILPHENDGSFSIIRGSSDIVPGLQNRMLETNMECDEDECTVISTPDTAEIINSLSNRIQHLEERIRFLQSANLKLEIKNQELKNDVRPNPSLMLQPTREAKLEMLRNDISEFLSGATLESVMMQIEGKSSNPLASATQKIESKPRQQIVVPSNVQHLKSMLTLVKKRKSNSLEGQDGLKFLKQNKEDVPMKLTHFLS